MSKLSKEYLVYTVINKLKKTLRLSTSADDFDWRWYHYHYQAELSEIKKVHTQVLSPGDYALSDGALSQQRNVLLLHPNHRLLYETILQLSPGSVLEVGCGGGDHLHNLSVLAANISLYGRDLSTEQLSFLRRRHPELKADIGQLDITLPYSSLWPVVDLSFTQAVIMHIQTGNGHLVALSNLFKMTTKYVILMENWRSHNFMDSIRQIFDMKMIPWGDLYFYYRISPELNKPHLMVVSAMKLAYEPLMRSDILL
jgi:SAM-dependent methyltransferase